MDAEIAQLKLERDASTVVSAGYLVEKLVASTQIEASGKVIAAMQAECAEAAQREQELRQELAACKASPCKRFSRAECLAAFKDALAQIRGDEDSESTRVLKDQLAAERQANAALRRQLDAVERAQYDEGFFHLDMLQNYVPRQTHDNLLAEVDGLLSEIKHLRLNLEALKAEAAKSDEGWLQLTGDCAEGSA